MEKIEEELLETIAGDDVRTGAYNIRKNGKNPSSVDCLLIQRHILGLHNIEQK